MTLLSASVFIAAVAIVVPAVLFYSGHWPSSNVVSCSAPRNTFFDGNEYDFEGECFFRNNYMDARQQFLYLAQVCIFYSISIIPHTVQEMQRPDN